MCQCSAGNIIYAKPGQSCNIFFRHISGNFNLCPSVNIGDGFFQRIGVHIIQHDNIRTCLHSFLYHIQIFYFYLNLTDKRCILLCSSNRFFYSACSSDMIIFQQYPVGKIISVVISTTDSYCIFFKNTIVWCCLSGIQKFDSGSF